MDDRELRDALRSLSDGGGAEHRLDLAALETGVRRARRRRALLTAGAASLAVVAVLGGGVVVLAADDPDLLEPAEVPAVGADVRQRAEEVYGSFAGTERQRNAGGILRAYGQNGAMDECMDEKGFPEWDWSLTRLYATPDPDPLMYATWFSEPNAPVLSEPLIVHKRALLAEAESNRDDIPPDEDAAIGQCITAVDDDRTEGEIEALARADTSRRLADAWVDMIQDASDQAADSSLYFDCMERAGTPVMDDDGIPWPNSRRVEPETKAIPSSASDPRVQSEEWQALLAEERVITDADWACRKDVYTEHIGDLLPAINRFEAEHEQEIEQAQQEWEVIEDQAEELGYTGQVGPLGR